MTAILNNKTDLIHRMKAIYLPLAHRTWHNAMFMGTVIDSDVYNTTHRNPQVESNLRLYISTSVLKMYLWYGEVIAYMP